MRRPTRATLPPHGRRVRVLSAILVTVALLGLLSQLGTLWDSPPPSAWLRATTDSARPVVSPASGSGTLPGDPAVCHTSAAMVELAAPLAAPPVEGEAADDSGGAVGWALVLTRYMAHWDSVTLVALGPSVAPLATLVQGLALAAAPLILNEYGVASRTGCGPNEWFSSASGCVSGRYHGTGLGPEGETPPHWARFGAPRALRRTRVNTFSSVPDLSQPRLVNDQHSSAGVRPADVAVYVVDAVDVGQRKRLLEHLAVQAQETLHAIIIYGALCDRDFKCVGCGVACRGVAWRGVGLWLGLGVAGPSGAGEHRSACAPTSRGRLFVPVPPRCRPPPPLRRLEQSVLAALPSTWSVHLQRCLEYELVEGWADPLHVNALSGVLVLHNDLQLGINGPLVK
jgi:hypothetical protein